MARMSLNRHIPSIINLAGEYVLVWYPNQPKTCRNCGSQDHLLKDCSSVRCFNCEKSGHRLENCEEPPTCTACKSEDHRLADCPFVKYSANVDTSPKEQTEEDKQRDKEQYRERLEQAKKKREAAEKHQAKMQMGPGLRKKMSKRMTKIGTKARTKRCEMVTMVKTKKVIKVKIKVKTKAIVVNNGVRRDLEVQIGPKKVMMRGKGEIERNLKLGKEESVIVRSAMLSVEKIIIMGVITLVVIFIVIALRAVMKTIILMRMMVGLKYLIDVGVMIVNF